MAAVAAVAPVAAVVAVAAVAAVAALIKVLGLPIIRFRNWEISQLLACRGV